MRSRTVEPRWSEKSRERLKALDREVAQLRARLRELSEQYPLERTEISRSEKADLSTLKSPLAASSSVPEAGGLGVRERPYGPGDERERERFAQYLASADLARMAPRLRRERIAQRNRALIMAILALFLLGAVIMLWFRHSG